MSLGVTLCQGAEVGIVTILDGNARVLRGTTWYKLVEGARVQEADVIDAADRARVQVELADGATLSLNGPAMLYVVDIVPRDSRQTGMVDLYLNSGWMKIATQPPGPRLRVRLPGAVVNAVDTVAVVHGSGDVFECFVERGTAKLADAGRGSDGPARDLKAGEFVQRASDKPSTIGARPPPTFIGAMPRYFMDSMPARTARFGATRLKLVAQREISYSEAQTWLAGPFRKSFMQRLQPRLSDAVFRDAVMANSRAYPEWSSLLFPTPTAEAAKAKAPPAATSGNGSKPPQGGPRKQ
jgi:FecR protein